MTVLIIVVILTIFISANCSLYEAVLYSTRLGTLESAKAKDKHRRLASLFIRMKKHISQPIAAILILNTLANTAGATLAGMYAADALGTSLVPLFSLVFTLSILFFAEIIPKTVGAIHWRSIWPFVVYPVQLMKSALRPAILVTEKLTNLLKRGEDIAAITEDEILALVSLGAKVGEISHEESLMVRNIINLEERQVEEIMTPRRMIFSLDATMTTDEAFEFTENQGFSRIPVYQHDKENIIGYVMLQDITSSKLLDKAPKELKTIARPIAFVPETTNCLTLLKNAVKQRNNVFIVSDEFGGVAGLVSLEDLLETILGKEIVDETDKIVDLQEEARKGKSHNRSSEN